MHDTARTHRAALPRHAPRPWLAAAKPTAPDLELLRRGFEPHVPGDAALQHLLDASRLVRCAAGPFTLDSPRRPEPSWWLLRQGVMALGVRTPGGQFADKRLIGPGDWLETAGAMDSPGSWSEAAECRTAVELLAIPVSALDEACAMDRRFPRAYAGVLAHRVRELQDSLRDMAGADVAGRLARWLLRQQPASMGDNEALVLLNERKQVIARHLGTTSESLSRALRRLSDDGLIEVRGYELRLRDLDSLQRLAGAATPAAPRQVAAG